MRKLATVALIGALALGACGSNDDVDKAPQAPKRRPMALDPSPPLSAQDIDAIVNQTGSAAPVSGNTSGAATQER